MIYVFSFMLGIPDTSVLSLSIIQHTCLALLLIKTWLDSIEALCRPLSRIHIHRLWTNGNHPHWGPCKNNWCFETTKEWTRAGSPANKLKDNGTVGHLGLWEVFTITLTMWHSHCAVLYILINVIYRRVATGFTHGLGRAKQNEILNLSFLQVGLVQISRFWSHFHHHSGQDAEL